MDSEAVTKTVFTVPEAAAVIGIKPDSLRKRIVAGLVEAQRIGTIYALSAEAVEAERVRVASKANKMIPDTPARTGNWATMKLPKPLPRPARHDSMEEIVEAAKSGIVTARILDASGQQIGEMKWQ